MFARGQRLDWLDSTEIIIEMAIGLGFFISRSVAAVTRTANASYRRLMRFVIRTSESLTMPWVVGARVLDSLRGASTNLAGMKRKIGVLP